MVHDLLDSMSSLTWGMGLVCLLVIIVLVLAAAALTKYLVRSRARLRHSKVS
jgi:hypothetical protein